MKKIYQISLILLSTMKLFSLKLPIIKKNDPLLDILVSHIKDMGENLKEIRPYYRVSLSIQM